MPWWVNARPSSHPKAQTTRRRIIGIVNEPGYQIIFSDTPGIIDQPEYKLHAWMNAQISRRCRMQMLFYTSPLRRTT